MDTFLGENADNCAAGGGHNDCAVEGSRLVGKKLEFCPLRESNARPSPYEGDALPLS